MLTMKLRRTLLQLHRYLGLTVAAFALLLASTGLLLNHTDSLGLDHRLLHQGWLLALYDIPPPRRIRSYHCGGHLISQWDEAIYLDQNKIDAVHGDLRGAVSIDSLLAIATDRLIALVADNGSLIDLLPLPAEANERWRLGINAQQRLLITAGEHIYISDDALTRFTLAAATPTDVQWSSAQKPDDASMETPPAAAFHGLPMERLLLDLHSGRLLTRLGKYWMDAVAIMMMGLAISGVWMWLGRRR